MSNETRKLPTRAGWWWYGDELLPSRIEVAEKDGALVARAYNRDILVTSGALRWLAPLPGPDVCAALAEYGEAYSLMILDARRGGSYANGEARRVRLAEDALDDAIRAERDGAA